MAGKFGLREFTSFLTIPGRLSVSLPDPARERNLRTRKKCPTTTKFSTNQKEMPKKNDQTGARSQDLIGVNDT